ncbi:hypothetical protein K443DRAFT_320694 [Laccaria amethystina LaAM-08-1]|uniref:Uncharacterized protein n=1 Tax=Laccaria amethystina LaAM-08-1 TaxID=1095629 RepID=A0A0C9WU80_9AGAR|nr:hypothetical protein K443DRAFT_320694 [Laccaria amethystina LaAM-08-1]
MSSCMLVLIDILIRNRYFSFSVRTSVNTCACRVWWPSSSTRESLIQLPDREMQDKLDFGRNKYITWVVPTPASPIPPYPGIASTT